MSMGLTPRQREFYDWLRADQSRCMMSFREMSDALGIASKSTIFNLLDALQERGLLRRLYGRARSVELARPRLAVVYGPDHFERLAAENRARWAKEAA